MVPHDTWNMDLSLSLLSGYRLLRLMLIFLEAIGWQ